MSDSYSRSRLLMSSDDTALLIVDAQEKLLRVIPHRDRLVWNLTRLLTGAQILQVPCLATEQYPEKLGPTVGELQPFVEPLAGKLTFSCCGQAEFIEQLKGIEAQKVVVAGIEAHVCVMQTSLDLLSEGYEVYVPVDAVGYLEGTGDSDLDGEVRNALELIEKLSKSDRVRQTFIRYAFRYFLGRNEMLSDSQTLIEADRAYVDSGGSFDSVIVSLLTSDSFIYRKEKSQTHEE